MTRAAMRTRHEISINVPFWSAFAHTSVTIILQDIARQHAAAHFVWRREGNHMQANLPSVSESNG